jgi:hypothetical protein
MKLNFYLTAKIVLRDYGGASSKQLLLCATGYTLKHLHACGSLRSRFWRRFLGLLKEFRAPMPSVSTHKFVTLIPLGKTNTRRGGVVMI